MQQSNLIIYSDGAYSSSRCQGGWAFVVLNENEEKLHSNFSGEKDTTNNRMEIMGCYEAMLWMIKNKQSSATILTDSMYVIGTMTLNWKRKKNNDLWGKMDDVVKQLNIEWKHVKGHEGNKWNDYCDMLAVQGSHLLIKEE